MLEFLFFHVIICIRAEVAELADALASGASGGNSIRVQVPASADKACVELVSPITLAIRTGA